MHRDLSVIKVKKFEGPPVVVAVYYTLVRHKSGVHLSINYPELNQAGQGVKIDLEGNNLQGNLALIVEVLHEGLSVVLGGR